MDRLDAYRMFAAVAELASFTDAARREGVTPAQASKRIAWLEETLGARLLERTTRSVALTTAGAAFLEQVKPVLAELDAIEDCLRADHAAASGPIRVTAPEVFGRAEVLPATMDFMRANPGVTARLQCTDRFVDLIEEGFDVAIRIGELKDSALVARRLGLLRFAVVASPAYLKARGAPNTLADLANHEIVGDLNLPIARRWVFDTAEGPQEVRLQGRLETNGLDAAREAALAGWGIACAPLILCANDLAEGRLHALLPQARIRPAPIWAVRPQARLTPARLRLYIDHLTAWFANRPTVAG